MRVWTGFSRTDDLGWDLWDARLRRKRIRGGVVECGEDFGSEVS